MIASPANQLGIEKPRWSAAAMAPRYRSATCSPHFSDSHPEVIMMVIPTINWMTSFSSCLRTQTCEGSPSLQPVVGESPIGRFTKLKPQHQFSTTSVAQHGASRDIPIPTSQLRLFYHVSGGFRGYHHTSWTSPHPSHLRGRSSSQPLFGNPTSTSETYPYILLMSLST